MNRTSRNDEKLLAIVGMPAAIAFGNIQRNGQCGRLS